MAFKWCSIGTKGLPEYCCWPCPSLYDYSAPIFWCYFQQDNAPSQSSNQISQSVPRKYPPHHYITTTSLNRWDKAGWIHAFMLFMPNSDATSEYRSRNQDSLDQATFFQSCIVQFCLRVLFLSDRSGTRCGLLLLESICFRVRRVVCSEMIFCISWL